MSNIILIILLPILSLTEAFDILQYFVAVLKHVYLNSQRIIFFTKEVKILNMYLLQINNDMLGGLVVEMEDRIIDLSVKTQINKYIKTLSESL